MSPWGTVSVPTSLLLSSGTYKTNFGFFSSGYIKLKPTLFEE